MEPSVHVLVFDGLADWEPTLALAALRDAGLPVKTVGFTKEPITTAAGLRVVPDMTWEELVPEHIKLLILAGSDGWQATEYPVKEFEEKLRALLDAKVPVAAACGATVAIARAGLFEGRPHTSNGLQWLSAIVPDYAGKELYRDELAVRADGLITATGAAPVEFAREVIAELDVMPQDKLSHWFTMFKTGRLPEGVEPAQVFAQ